MLTIRIENNKILLISAIPQIMDNIEHILNKSNVVYNFNPENFTYIIDLSLFNYSVVTVIVDYCWSIFL